MRIGVLLLLACLTLNSATAKADPITGATILGAVGLTMDGLEELASQLGAEGARLIGDLRTSLDTQSSKLRRLSQDVLARPIGDLNHEMRATAESLHRLVTRTNDLLALQRSCLFADVEVLLGALRTVGAELGEATPLVGNDEPFLTYFRFDGHHTGVVPPEGGTFVISGGHLWPDRDDVAPLVTIQDHARTTNLETAEGRPSADDHTVSFELSRSLVESNEGKCLAVRVDVREDPWYGRVRVVATRYLPMCLPLAATVEYSVDAELLYQCGQTEERWLDWQNFYAECSDCYHSNCSFNVSRSCPPCQRRLRQLPLET